VSHDVTLNNTVFYISSMRSACLAHSISFKFIITIMKKSRNYELPPSATFSLTLLSTFLPPCVCVCVYIYIYIYNRLLLSFLNRNFNYDCNRTGTSGQMHAIGKEQYIASGTHTLYIDFIFANRTSSCETSCGKENTLRWSCIF
jgi:hypothetical protein